MKIVKMMMIREEAWGNKGHCAPSIRWGVGTSLRYVTMWLFYVHAPVHPRVYIGVIGWNYLTVTSPHPSPELALLVKPVYSYMRPSLLFPTLPSTYPAELNPWPQNPWGSSPASDSGFFFSYCAVVTWASWRPLKRSDHVPVSGPLPFLFPPPEVFYSIYVHGWYIPSFLLNVTISSNVTF